MENKKINNVPMKESETKEEKMLLGLVYEQAERIGYGTLVLELTIKDGIMIHGRLQEVNKSINFGKMS